MSSVSRRISRKTDARIVPHSKIKMVILGEAGVGKTTLLDVIVQEHRIDVPLATIGVDFKQIIFETRLRVKYEIQIWDTGGQERFKSLATGYIRNSDIAIFVFALDDRKSFEALTSWYTTAQANLANSQYVCFLFGNKSDLHREVSQDAIDKFVENHKIAYYFQVAAKLSDVPVDEFLDQVINMFHVYGLYERRRVEQAQSINYMSYQTIHEPVDRGCNC